MAFPNTDDEEFKVFQWPPNSPDLNAIVKSSKTFRGLVESIPPWVGAVLAHTEDQQHIKHVVIMVWLIGVYTQHNTCKASLTPV